jgi:hypothetical protein
LHRSPKIELEVCDFGATLDIDLALLAAGLTESENRSIRFMAMAIAIAGSFVLEDKIQLLGGQDPSVSFRNLSSHCDQNPKLLLGSRASKPGRGINIPTRCHEFLTPR